MLENGFRVIVNVRQATKIDSLFVENAAFHVEGNFLRRVCERPVQRGLSTAGLWIVSCERYKACHDASFIKLA